jgi:hypothetical protein
MFNEISRQKLREIIEKKYPELQSFADLLYEQNGQTGVKMAGGSWNYIPVQEGFSQGCPMSPVFAALVLGELLQEMDTHFRLKAASRLSQGAPMDDHRGGAPIILAYVDDVNCLLPHEDVEEFCAMFARLGAKLGAKLNTEKTCILTSTNGTDVPGELLKSNRIGRNSVGASLQRAIKTYSTKLAGKRVDGLRILGIPVGSHPFCQAFIMAQIGKMEEDALALLSGL